MNTIGWLFILVAAYIIRLGIKGQVFDGEGNFTLLDSLEKTFVNLVNGKSAELTQNDAAPGGNGLNAPTPQAVMPEGGTGTPADAATDAPGSSGGSSSLLDAMHKRAGKVGGRYVFGAQGPNAYDCSGLVYRSLQDIHPETRSLPRFTTFTMLRGPWAKHFKPGTGAVGDVVLWNTHIGVVSGKGVFYSARNPRAGTGDSPIKGFLSNEPAPKYYRYV